MRLALAIASFVVLIVHGVGVLRSVLSQLGAAPDRVLRAGAQLRKRCERAALIAAANRADHRHQFGDTRVDRCTTCHIAADDPRFADTRSR